MKTHKLIYRTALGAGILFGIAATGAGAKANTNRPTSAGNQQINHINQNQDHHSLVKASQPDLKIQRNPRKQRLLNLHHQTSRIYHHVISSNLKRDNSYSKYISGPTYHSTRVVKAHHVHHLHHLHKHNHGQRLRHHRIRHHDHHQKTHRTKHHLDHPNVNNQYSYQSVNNHAVHHTHDHNWFRDGLDRHNFNARNWVSWHESNHRWRILSYGGVCVGYFQLNPHYLGYRHGHVDLRPEHQVRVADRYVKHRYGNWVNAKRFWESHHWY